MQQHVTNLCYIRKPVYIVTTAVGACTVVVSFACGGRSTSAAFADAVAYLTFYRLRCR